MTNTPPQPDTIWRLRTELYPSFALLAAIRLDVFTPLSGGPLTVEQAAEVLGADSDKLRPLLYILVESGLLTVEGERFSNSPESDQYLVKGNSNYMGAGYEAFSEMWNALWNSADSIRTGSAQAKADYASMSKEELESHFHSFHQGTLSRGRSLLANYDFSLNRRLIDVAGGTGGVAIAIAQAFPNLRATVIDLPSVTPLTLRLVQEAGVADRVDVVAADVVNGTLEGSFDVAVMCSFIPVLSRDQAQRALKNVAHAMEPGGTIYINDPGTLDDSRLSPPITVRQNLWFINVFDDGQARTEQERRGWMADAGFEDIERKSFPDGSSIMVAKKPA
ncbi:MAG: methyltransferase domain-containing protein [Chloroflexi bacterium]|nr:methyltransferase domain-containing protein [Chloroflexota bacterium]